MGDSKHWQRIRSPATAGAKETKQEDSVVQGTEENYRWGKIARYLFDNLTSALTLLYIYVTAIGMIYSWVLYGRFEINIFDYSEVGDFLLAAFKIPAGLFVSAFIFVPLYLGGVFMAWMIRGLWQTIRRRPESERKGFYKSVVRPFLAPSFVGGHGTNKRYTCLDIYRPFLRFNGIRY